MTNIVHSYIEKYLDSIYPKENKYMSRLRTLAEEDGVPIVDRQVGEFLKILLHLTKPDSILELGTAVGYSASLFAQTLSDVYIDTVEINPDMAIMARTNFHNLSLENRIRLHVCDALDFLKKDERFYDFIFIDAAKGQYQEFFDLSLERLDKNGLIVIDNVLFHGMIASNEYAVRRKITIIKRLRNFLPEILSDERFDSSLLPIGDGLLLVRRKDEEN